MLHSKNNQLYWILFEKFYDLLQRVKKKRELMRCIIVAMRSKLQTNLNVINNKMDPFVVSFKVIS